MSKPAYLIFVISIFCSLLACQQEPNKPFADHRSLLDFKQAPADHFFLQRAYPDASFDIKAYETALQSVRNQQLQRSGPFDHAWVQQGPGNIGARVNAIAVHPTNEQIIYAGFSTGGLFKTTDGGQNWSPVFDDQPYLSIGDISLDPTNPEMVYVGTGDPNISGYPFIGDGVYKSSDGGQNWIHLGLADQRIVSRIALDPGQAGTLYAACMGLPFEPNSHRGLYKSTDDGANWSQVLYVNDSTGIIDLLIDPINPQVVYAAAWNRIRNNSQSMVAGPDAKIYKTTDGGQNWTPLSNGLPSGTLGRIGLAMSGQNSQTLFASYVNSSSQLHGIYKTTNGGQSWSTLTMGGENGLTGNSMGGFGWYFGQIRVDPANDDHLFLLGVQLWETFNGGALWIRRTHTGDPVHVDNHDLVMATSGNTYLGTDGGLYKLPPGSTAWQDIENIPTNQFYRVGYNPHRPELYYGGAQDNGSLAGNAASIDGWERLAGGDGFQPVFHPSDSLKFYMESQLGGISVTTNGGQNFFSATAGIHANDQRNWDMPYFMSPHRPDNLFAGTFRVYRAQSPSYNSPWQPISSDLTKAQQSSSPASFHTISTLDQSPVDSNLLYVGTSDGNVWRSTNLGANWEMIQQGLPNRYVTDIKAHPDSANQVYVTFSGYKYNDFSPHIFKSTNRGDSWQAINGNLPNLAINELLVLPDRAGQWLFVATDGGVYGSLDGGGQWSRVGHNMPVIPVYDMALNEMRNELVAGTFARSILSFPLDSVGSGPAMFSISGQVRREDGVPVPNVTMQLSSGGGEEESITDSNGSYSVNNTANPVCNLRPSKNYNHRNGLSAFDIVTMQKHILGIQSLDSPYKRIAADVNQSGTITTFDIVLIRKLLLVIDTAFTQSESWRFVKADFIFADPNNPFAQPFPEQYDCAGQSANQQGVDFVAVKMGDVNLSADPAALVEAPASEGRSAIRWQVNEQHFEPGDEVALRFRSAAMSGKPACQFTLQFDPEVLQFEGLKPGILPNVGKANFGLNYLEQGLITFVWTNPIRNAFEINDILYTLKFRALEKGALSNFLTINAALTPNLAYDKAGTVSRIDLQFDTENELDPNFKIHPLSNPLPAGSQLSVVLEAKEADRIRLELFSFNGHLADVTHIDLVAGRTVRRLQDFAVPKPGVYVLQATTDSGAKAVCRVICY